MNSIEKSNTNNLSNPELNAPEIKIPDVDKLIHPDFEKDDFISCINKFNKVSRRFGARI